LTVELILSWASAHRERTGQWPNTRSGAIPEAPGRTWSSINVALHRGSCGLPGGDSLSSLLARRVGKPLGRRDKLRLLQIEGWARSHQRRSGCWPTARSGEVVDALGETWRAIDKALRQGGRGLPGGDSLARLVARLQAGESAPAASNSASSGQGNPRGPDETKNHPARYPYSPADASVLARSAHR
jgi:hypothetical protein